MTQVQKILLENADPEYAAFQANLCPTIDSDTIIGIRVPRLREIAASIKGTEAVDDFLRELPHKYYDENMLHSILISQIKDPVRVVELLDEYLPYVDNWAACDTITPHILKKKKDGLMDKIDEWIASDKVYTCRFGVKCLMSYYLDDDFDAEYCTKVAKICSEEYYVNMMCAWYFATALAKQWEAVIPFIEEHRIINKWVHNKAIQKARESYRITPEQKEYLKSLKI